MQTFEAIDNNLIHQEYKPSEGNSYISGNYAEGIFPNNICALPLCDINAIFHEDQLICRLYRVKPININYLISGIEWSIGTTDFFGENLTVALFWNLVSNHLRIFSIDSNCGRQIHKKELLEYLKFCYYLIETIPEIRKRRL